MYSTQEVMLHTGIAVALSFLLTVILGHFLIPVLRALKAGQSIKEIGPTWHMSKQGTPTMGGIMFIVPIAVLIGADWMVGGIPKGAVYVFLFSLVFGIIGFIDDYMKVVHHENTGLTASQKFLLQVAASILMVVLLRHEGYLRPDLYIPFTRISVPVAWPLYMTFAAFVMVGTVNAVNITDGVDGLSTSVTVPVAVFFIAVTCLWKQSDLNLFACLLLGGLFGFLCYNHYPAKVFMGDTGSLFLGGAVCGLAFATDMPLILILVGIVYIAETVSDILQVGYFKLTHGKRIFRMAPLHHHFEMGGWKEIKVVRVFAAVSALFCALAFLGVMGRY